MLLMAGWLASCGTVRQGARDKQTGDETAAVTLSEDDQRRYDYYYLEALRQKTLRHHTEAFDLLTHCLSINPQAPSALYEMAQYHVFLKQTDRAVAYLEQAVRFAPDNYWYGQALSNLYLQQNQLEKATKVLETMKERFPDKLDPPYTLLGLYNQQEKYDQALGILSLLELRMGKSEQLSMEKYRIYQQKNDTAQAFREIESLVSEYPMDARYRVVLGDAYMQANRQAEAYALYRDALKQEPDNAVAMYSLADYYRQTGQTALYEQQLDSLLLNKKVDTDTRMSVMRQFIVQNEQAGRDSTQVIALFDRIMEQEPDDAGMPMLYAQYLMSKGMTRQTLPVLEQVIDIEPTNTAARMMLLGEAVRKEDYKAVIQLCEAGVEANPDKLEFYFYLAIGYNQAERTEEVIDICRRALKQVTKESNREVVSDFYSILGDSYHTLKRSDEAYAAYDSALVYKPDNIGALNNYAYYLSMERRNLDKAEEMSYRTVKAEPANATYLDTYAWILFEKGNYAEARIYIDQAMQGEGAESDVVVEHCGDIYYKCGETEQAVRYWEKSLQMGNKSETLKKKIKQKKYIIE